MTKASYGEANGRAVLEQDDVRLIWQAKGQISAADLAEKFGCSAKAVYHIWQGVTWRWYTAKL